MSRKNANISIKLLSVPTQKKYKIFAFSKNKSTFTEGKFHQICKNDGDNEDHNCNRDNESGHCHDLVQNNL